MGNCRICQRRQGTPLARQGFAICDACLGRVADKMEEGGLAAVGLGFNHPSSPVKKSQRKKMEKEVEARLSALVARLHLLKLQNELNPASANVILSLYYAQEGRRGEAVAAADKALNLEPPREDRKLVATALMRVMNADELLALRGIVFPN